MDSGVYMATPLSRLNASDGMATPLAQEEYEKFYATLGGKPVHQRLATHWARLIELLYAAERWVELATDPEITSPNVHTKPTEIPTEGVGIVEAPRGTLTHHYWTDERGIVTKANLIVGTTNNYAPIQMSTQQGCPQPDQGRQGHTKVCSTWSRWPSAPTIPASAAPPMRCPADAAGDHHP
jgi:F420-non-reducing hydrogenase large subunit